MPNPENQTDSIFFKALGAMLYGIVVADKKEDEAELVASHTQMKDLASELPSFVSIQSTYELIKEGFKAARKERQVHEQAMETFFEEWSKRSEAFRGKWKNTVLKAAIAITQTDYPRNKGELTALFQLQQFLENEET